MPAKRLTKRQQTLKKFFGIGNVTDYLIKKQGFTNRSEFFEHYDELYKFIRRTEAKKERKQKAKQRRNVYELTVSFTGVVKNDKSKDGTSIWNTAKSKRIVKTFHVRYKDLSNKDYYEKQAIKEWVNEDTTYHLGGQDVKIDSAVRLKHQTKKSLSQIKLNGISLEYSKMQFGPNHFKLSDIDKKQGTCVIDYLVYRYGDKIKSLTHDNIIRFLTENHKDICKISGQKSAFDIKQGIDTYQIEMINKHFIRRPMLAVNFDEKVFHRYDPHTKSTKQEYNLIYMISNNHFYPIEDKRLRHQVMNSQGMLNVQSDQIDDKTAKKKIKSVVDLQVVLDPTIEELIQLRDRKVYYTDRSDLISIFTELIKHTNTIINDDLYCDKRGLQSIEWSEHNVFIYCDTDYQDTQYNHRMLNMTGPVCNLIGLANKYFDMKYELPKSQYNSAVSDIMHGDLSKTIAFRDTFTLPKSGQLRAIDQSGCYPSAMYFNKYKYCIFDSFDEVTPYDNQGYDRVGFYFIETDNYFPLTGNGFYHYGSLIEAAKRNINFVVKYQLLSSSSLPANHFVKFCDDILSKCNNSKLMINGFIGCLGRTEKTRYNCNFTSDIKQASEYFYNKTYNQDKNIHVQSIANDLYMCKEEIVTHFNEDSKPIYQQVLQQSHFRLYDMYQKTKGRLIQIKTDCLIIEGGVDVELTGKFGGFKLEDVPEKFEVHYQQPSTQTFELKCQKWNHIDSFNGESCLIDGLAGTGKTYTVNNIIKQLQSEGKTYERFAPTNAAALLIGGKTLHKGLGISGTACDGGVARIYHLYDKTKPEIKYVGSTTQTVKERYEQHLEEFKSGNPSCSSGLLFKQAGIKNVVFEQVKEFEYTTSRDILKRETEEYDRCYPKVYNMQRPLSEEKLTMFSNKLIDRMKNFDYVLIDEMSMITSQMYNVLKFIKKRCNCKFIIAGDSNQLDAIEDKNYEYKNSTVLKELCGYNKINLTKNMRSDDRMFKLYHKTLAGEDVGSEFTQDKVCRLNICYYNKTRHKLNKEISEQVAKRKKKVMNIDDKPVYKDLPLVCKQTNKQLDIVNNERFVVTSFQKNIVNVKNDRVQLTIQCKDLFQYFDMAYAITGHCSQGQTFDCQYTIHDWDRIPEQQRNSWRYVAISRTSNKDNIFIFR